MHIFIKCILIIPILDVKFFVIVNINVNILYIKQIFLDTFERIISVVLL